MGEHVEMKRFPCVYMRGGTSKAVMFHEKDLPEDKSTWNDIFLKVMGTPDVKQIDGMGGTVSSTSKIAVIAKSKREDIDIDYTFFQVDIALPQVDDKGNCGNISSAVGPFAIDEGLVPAVEPITVVRVLNTNTNKVIEEHVRVKNGRAMVYGDAAIKGVPGTASRIDMYFENPGGAKTGKLFPTGNKTDVLDIPGCGSITVTIIDCANPVVFVKAKDLGLTGKELLELNQNKKAMEELECIRGMAAVKFGFVESWQEATEKSMALPKISIVSAPQDYTDLDGNAAEKEQMNVCCRGISVGTLHKAYPMTVALATGAAARIKGTVVNDVAGDMNGDIIKLGHTSGIVEIDIKLDGDNVIKGGFVRTARRIMDGFIYIRK